MLSVLWSVVDRSVIIQALKKGLIEHEASDTGGVPRWKSSCPDRLAEATVRTRYTLAALIRAYLSPALLYCTKETAAISAKSSLLATTLSLVLHNSPKLHTCPGIRM